MAAIAGSPFATGAFPEAVAVTPSGNFAYTINGNSNNLSAWTVSAQTGAFTLVPGSPFANITPSNTQYPIGLAIDRGGRFAYVVEANTTTLAVFAIDPTTGALANTGITATTGSAPFAVAVY